MIELRAYYQLKEEFEGECPVNRMTNAEWFEAEVAYYTKHGGI